MAEQVAGDVWTPRVGPLQCPALTRVKRLRRAEIFTLVWLGAGPACPDLLQRGGMQDSAGAAGQRSDAQGCMKSMAGW